MILKYKFLALTIIYAAGILWFSFQPDYPVAAPSSWLRQAFMNFLHIPAYAGLAGLLVLTMQGLRIKDQGVRGKDEIGEIKSIRFFNFSSLIHYPLSLSFSVFIIATLFGILNEFIQAGVPGRFFSIGDMIRNAIGAGIGIWVIRKILRKK